MNESCHAYVEVSLVTHIYVYDIYICLYVYIYMCYYLTLSHCNTLSHIAARCRIHLYVYTAGCDAQKHTAMWDCRCQHLTLQHTATHTTIHCNTHCNTLQDGMLKNKLTYEIIDASTIGIENNDGIVLGQFSDIYIYMKHTYISKKLYDTHTYICVSCIFFHTYIYMIREHIMCTFIYTSVYIPTCIHVPICIDILYI